MNINKKPMKIVIASAGRRAHYIEWFQEALRAQAIDGEVIAMEYRTTSPSFALADRSVPMPAYNSSEYTDAMRMWFTAERPSLFLCMNDYELNTLSGGLADELRALGCVVAVLDESSQSVVSDKYRMADVLRERGIPTPATYLGTEVAAAIAADPAAEKFVVKHRFGSGSTGLHIAAAADVKEAVADSATTALGPDGRATSNGLDDVVVQQYLPGDEYGVDGVFSAVGDARLLGVIARRTDTIRHGDPDVATTVASKPFQRDIAALGNLLSPTGSINVDFRESAEGRPVVIDINPRLGGGYPYNHRAGADLPSALIRSAAGLEHIPALLDYELGVTTVRREEFTVLRRAADSTNPSASDH